MISKDKDMISKDKVFVNEKHWRGMSEDQLRDFTKLVFDYYRQEGFPYYPTDYETRDNDFKKLI